MDEISFKICSCCGYEREENDHRNPNRCPRCNQRYMFARAGYMRGEVYRPNSVLFEARVLYTVLAAVLISHAAFGILNNEIYIPGKSSGIYLYGTSLWMMSGSLFLAGLALTSMVVDHYDKRDNEATYARFLKSTSYSAGTLYVMSFVLAVYQGEALIVR